jgi:hypothetical protein
VALPNFLIIGAAKAGTTSLYCYLAEHPQIYMSPIKEPRFFAIQGRGEAFLSRIQNETQFKGSVCSLEEYHRMFDGATGAIAIGEASPLYLGWSEASASAIHDHLPDVKLIAILRHPVERAFSHYKMALKLGIEPHQTFEKALTSDPKRVNDAYINLGFYSRALDAYDRRFSREQIRIYFYEDLVSSPASMLRDMFRFLGVDENYLPRVKERYNVSPTSFSRDRSLADTLSGKNSLGSFARAILPAPIRRPIARLIRRLNHFEPRLLPKTRSRLAALYHDDVLRLQVRTNHDLSSWLN